MIGLLPRVPEAPSWLSGMLGAHMPVRAVTCARVPVLEWLQQLWTDQDPRFLSRAMWCLFRVGDEQRPRFMSSLLQLVEGHTRATCAVMAVLASRETRLDDDELLQLTHVCGRSLLRISSPMKAELYTGLLKAGRVRFARQLAAAELRRAPARESGRWLVGILEPLLPSHRALLQPEVLLRICRERMPADIHPTALEPLVRSLDLRSLRDPELRDWLLSTWSLGMRPELLHVRHRERLYLLQRLTSDPALRARLTVQHDLAHMSLLGSDNGIPQLVLGMLSNFPQVLNLLPEPDAEAVIRFVLRRLFRRLTEQDHELIAEVLCSPQRPEPFFQAYFGYLQELSKRSSRSVQLEIWSVVYGAWLQRHMSPLRRLADKHLREQLLGLEKDVRRELLKTLKRQFGEGIASWKLEEQETRQSWLRPWLKGSKSS